MIWNKKDTNWDISDVKHFEYWKTDKIENEKCVRFLAHVRTCTMCVCDEAECFNWWWIYKQIFIYYFWKIFPNETLKPMKNRANF